MGILFCAFVLNPVNPVHPVKTPFAWLRLAAPE
jgi:hypothetical protein